MLLAIGAGVVADPLGTGAEGGPGRLGLLRVSRDPTLDLYGWDQVAAELKQRGLLDRPGTFLFTSTWYHSGHLAFATRGSTTPVLCYNSWDARSFAFWSRSERLGRARTASSSRSTATPAEPHCYDRWFRADRAARRASR